MEEFEMANFDILAMSKTKIKEHRMMMLGGEHVMGLHYSGVKIGDESAEHVSCLIAEKHAKVLSKWEFMSQRILTIEMQLDQQSNATKLCTK